MNRTFYKPKCRKSIHETDNILQSSIANPYLLRFMDYGFTYIDSGQGPNPKCLICYQVFDNKYMMSEYLQQHLALKHKEYRNKTRTYFEKQLIKLEKAKNKSTLMDWSVEDIIPSPSNTLIEKNKSPNKTVTSKRKSVNQQYSEKYLKLGFTYVGDDATKQKPKCLLCYEILSNSSMHESALRDHLESKHTEYVEKPIEFFIKQLQKLEKAKTKSRRSSIVPLTSDNTPPKSLATVKSASPKKVITLRYAKEFLKYGFTYIGDETKPNPKCILCHQILPNTSMRDSLLYHHFETKHNEYIDQPVEYFEKQLENIEKNTNSHLQRSSTINNTLKAEVHPKKPTTPRKSLPGRKSICQKYSNDYLKFGFTYIGDEAKPKPKCLLCYEILSNSSMNETALHDHLTNKHKDYIDRPVDFFVKQLNKFLKSQGRAGQR